MTDEEAVWARVRAIYDGFLAGVELSDGTRQVVRNTSIWRRTDGAWLAVHNHEDVAGGSGQP